jgi:hypothetical protein
MTLPCHQFQGLRNTEEDAYVAIEAEHAEINDTANRTVRIAPTGVKHNVIGVSSALLAIVILGYVIVAAMTMAPTYLVAEKNESPMSPTGILRGSTVPKESASACPPPVDVNVKFLVPEQAPEHLSPAIEFANPRQGTVSLFDPGFELAFVQVTLTLSIPYEDAADDNDIGNSIILREFSLLVNYTMSSFIDFSSAVNGVLLRPSSPQVEVSFDALLDTSISHSYQTMSRGYGSSSKTGEKCRFADFDVSIV